MPAEVEFTEVAAHPRVESVSYAHLSIELGHLYMEDLQRGPAYLSRHFREIVPWVEAARRSCEGGLTGRTARISTCFLVDDYFTRLSPPHEVIPQLVDAASAAGLRIDYLARESAWSPSHRPTPTAPGRRRTKAAGSPTVSVLRPTRPSRRWGHCGRGHRRGKPRPTAIRSSWTSSCGTMTAAS